MSGLPAVGEPVGFKVADINDNGKPDLIYVFVSQIRAQLNNS